ncbi:AzlD domain-containing protein [Salinigranum halophilum]|jgi:branched-subunit amino acid transport protein|uniref:AzlD domain-containing protein n=1 Tax=Salinigranum halophilum TaxID=2565931 RepID=UPI00115EB979|nr:AzlD domain-containing protein [Salinigranum halophilum]
MTGVVAQTSYGPVGVWTAIVAVGIATFCIRLSFIYLFGRIDTVPPRVTRALRYVPAAVLAALVVPSVVTIEPTAVETLTADRVIAGGLAAVVAWYTEDVTATIVVGLVALWVVRFAVPV